MFTLHYVHMDVKNTLNSDATALYDSVTWRLALKAEHKLFGASEQNSEVKRLYESRRKEVTHEWRVLLVHSEQGHNLYIQKIFPSSMCDYRRGSDCWMHLLTTYWPQVTITLLRISTLQITPR
jgi:hypothetical protein